MIIINNQKFIEAKFRNEQEIEDLVIANSEHFFGPSSVFIPKFLIKTTDGVGTIPDGFAIDIATRVWYVVEAELSHHKLWEHIAPQVTKQILAANRPITRQLLTEILVQMITEDTIIMEKFEDENIDEINIRKVIDEIFAKPPIVGMPIDSVSNDLRGWAETLRNDVRLWVVKKYVQFGDTSVVAYSIPEEYRPVLDTTELNIKTKSGITTYDVTLQDFLESGLLPENEKLKMFYTPRGGEQNTYEAILQSDGSLTVLNENFNTPSYAALYCIQDAGSERKTVNGWTKWRTENGETLAQHREKYLKKKEEEITIVEGKK